MPHPHRPGLRTSATRLVVVLLAVALAGCGVDIRPDTPSERPSGAAPTALSLRELATLPEVHVPGRLEVVAGTGSRFITLGAGGAGRYSADNGRTFTDVPADVSVRANLQGDGGPSFGSLMGYQGTFAGVVASKDPSGGYLGLQRWNPDTGETTFFPYPMGGDQPGAKTALYPVDYVGAALVLSDGRIIRLAGSEATPLEPVFAATPRLQGLQTAMTKDAATAVQAGYSLTGNYGYLNVAPADGSAGAKAYRIPGLLSMDVSAFTIHYLVGTADALRVCKALVTSPTKPSCRFVALGDFRRSRYAAHLTTSIGADQVYLARRTGGGVRQWLVREGRVTLVAKGDAPWQWLPFRDSEQPMALVDSGTNVTTAATINRNGKPTPLFAAPASVSPATALALSPGRLSYQQDQFSTSAGTRRAVWTQTFGDGALGGARRLTGNEATSISASGARTAVQLDRGASRGDHPVTFYDGRTRTATSEAARSSWLGLLSGPYALIGRQVVRTDGHRFDTGPVLASFGSLVVEASTDDEASERTFRLRNLERPDAAPVALDLPRPAGRLYRNDGWLLWGDWVRTIAWTDRRGTHVAEVAGLSAPARLLGVLAASRLSGAKGSWRPEFDLTAPVAGGVLELRSDSGELVRMLATPAGAEGSIRGVEWDGRDDAGTRVAPGTYSWTLVVDGVAGGRVVSVDGSQAPSGRVVVTA